MYIIIVHLLFCVLMCMVSSFTVSAFRFLVGVVAAALLVPHQLRIFTRFLSVPINVFLLVYNKFYI